MTDQFRTPTSSLAVSFFGVSGAGKGTQAELLAAVLEKIDDRGVERIEMGDLIRKYAQTDTPMAARAREEMMKGGLLPSFVPVYLMGSFLNEHFDGTEHLILDGAARRPLQAELIDQMVVFYGHHERHAIVLELSIEVARERLRERGRFDDIDLDALKRRFDWYNENVIPSIEVFERLGWNAHRIDGMRSVEAVQADIFAELGIL